MRATKRRATSLPEPKGDLDCEIGRIPIPVEVGMFEAYGLTFQVPVFIRRNTCFKGIAFACFMLVRACLEVRPHSYRSVS